MTKEAIKFQIEAYASEADLYSDGAIFAQSEGRAEDAEYFLLHAVGCEKLANDLRAKLRTM